MIYQQEVTLLIPYDPEESSEPSQWFWTDLCDHPIEIEVISSGPVTVIEDDGPPDDWELGEDCIPGKRITPPDTLIGMVGR
jgi:hypothetical protein